ncbi:hypothetical protein C8Q77DRAFT_1103657 [Trametes polyzona]|nr:hypothetical protein C8Q77DRAFT_1103657 [Trametes polyzona]
MLDSPSDKQPATANSSVTTSFDSVYDDPPPSYSDHEDVHGAPEPWRPNDPQRPFETSTDSASLPGHSSYTPSAGAPSTLSQPYPASAATHSPRHSPSASQPSVPSSPTHAHHSPSATNPPPASFQRAPSHNMPYGPFEPLEVPALEKSIERGFTTVLPASTTQPHPFGTHDVTEPDWLRFLDDVKRVCALAVRDRASSTSSFPPPGRFGGRGLVSGLVAQGIQGLQDPKPLGRQDLKPVVELLQCWNQYFFNPRCMEVDLAGPVQGNQDDSKEAAPPSVRGGFGLGCPRQRFAPGRRGRRGGLIGGGLRELGAELVNMASGSSSSGGGTGERWRIIVRYRRQDAHRYGRA